MLASLGMGADALDTIVDYAVLRRVVQQAHDSSWLGYLTNGYKDVVLGGEMEGLCNYLVLEEVLREVKSQSKNRKKSLSQPYNGVTWKEEGSAISPSSRVTSSY